MKGGILCRMMNLSWQPWNRLCACMTTLQDENFYQTNLELFYRFALRFQVLVKVMCLLLTGCINVRAENLTFDRKRLTSHLLSCACLFSRMVQLSAATSAQWAMVMAMGQDRSRPGGPYVTAGLKKISGSSSETVLHTQRCSTSTY